MRKIPHKTYHVRNNTLGVNFEVDCLRKDLVRLFFEAYPDLDCKHTYGAMCKMFRVWWTSNQMSRKLVV